MKTSRLLRRVRSMDVWTKAGNQLFPATGALQKRRDSFYGITQVGYDKWVMCSSRNWGTVLKPVLTHLWHRSSESRRSQWVYSGQKLQKQERSITRCVETHQQIVFHTGSVWVARLSFHEGVRSSEIWRNFETEPLFPGIKKSQLRGFRHITRDPHGCFPEELFWVHSTGPRLQGRRRPCQRDCISQLPHKCLEWARATIRERRGLVWPGQRYCHSDPLSRSGIETRTTAMCVL